MAAVRLKKSAQELLVRIHPATMEAPFRVEDVNNDDFKALVAAGFILSQAVPGQPNSVDAILSDDGKTRAKQYLPAEKPRAPMPAAGSFAVFKLDKLPEKKPGRASGARSVYPFQTITEVGGAFFVAATTERPEPWKAMRSTVSTLNSKRKKDYADALKTDANTPAPVLFDLFEDTRSPGEGQPPVKGAVIYGASHAEKPQAAA